MLSLITSIRLFTAILLAFVSIPFGSFAATIFVNVTATGANNGENWTDAYTDLQDALEEAVSGDEIWVARGTYYPSAPFDFDASGGTDTRESVFRISSGISLYGGFLGSEAIREARNWNANLTILSGDIDHNDINTDGDNIANSVTDIMGSNAYHVLLTQNASHLTKLDGFIITAGKADAAILLESHPNRNGGGFINLLTDPLAESSPVITNCQFIGNYASIAGGAFYASSTISGAMVSPSILNSFFNSNETNFIGGAIFIGSYTPGNYNAMISNSEFTENRSLRSGGAVYLRRDHAIIESCKFTDNEVTSISPEGETSAGSGGAVAILNSDARFTSCIFTGNKATGNPTGPTEGGGGGAVHINAIESLTIPDDPSDPIFIACGFYDNIASDNGTAWGGAVAHRNDGSILEPSYINCVFAGNYAQTHGGAVHNFTRRVSEMPYEVILYPKFTNCTFYNNEAGSSGGALYFSGFNVDGYQQMNSSVENCILWNNSDLTGSPEIFNSGATLISYSLVDGSGGSVSWDGNLGTDGGNNIDIDPNFIDAANPLGPDNIPNDNDGLKLNPFSTAINAGNSSALLLTGISSDFSGLSRILGSAVDMGAYENVGIYIPWLEIYWLWDWKPFEPNCLTCPWSFLLLDRHFSPFTWNGPAQLIIESDKAIISGQIIERDGKAGFEVYLELINKQNWIQWSNAGRGYVAVTPEAYETAKKMHQTWSYWELSKNSKLTGFGSVSGTLQLKHWPSDFRKGFQQGEGGNSLDKDLGISGSFTYSGKIKINGKSTKLFGIGSLNADSKLCNENCEVLKSSDISSPVPEEEPSTIIYPNPAHNFFIIKRNIEETYNVELYSVQGALILKSDSVNDTEYRIDAESLEPGLYLVRIITATDEERHFITIND